MSIKSDFAGQYSSKQDELLICEGGKTSSILLMLKGKLDAFLSPFETGSNEDISIINSSFRIFSLDQNSFIGVNDILGNSLSSFTIKAEEASILYCFPVESLKGIQSIISTQKDYSTYIVSSLATLIDLSYTSYQKLLPICQSINSLVQNLSVYYWAIKDKYYFRNPDETEELAAYHNIYEAAKSSDYRFFPIDSELLLSQYKITESPENTEQIDVSGIEYFSRLLNIPLDQRKGFFNSDEIVCEYHIQKGSEFLNLLVNSIKSLLSSIYKNINSLYLSSCNLLHTYGKIVLDSREDKEAAINVLGILEQAVDILSRNIEKLQNEFDAYTDVNVPQLSVYYETIKEKAAVDMTPNSSDEVYTGAELPQELENSVEKILRYCSCSQEFSDSFNKRLSHFRMIKDKTSTDPEVRELRSSIASDFFIIYEEAFKRSRKDGSCPKLISMFLNFGYMDERLLTKEQVIALYRLCNKEYPCPDFSVYSAEKWMDKIYSNQKDPSINDFGQDYYDIFRDMKKRKLVTDQDKAAYDRDSNAKLDFEINNMIKTNQKVCHGQMSSYFPVLYKDIVTRDLEKAIVTPTKVQRAIDAILAIDFSIFYREIWYKNEKKGIEKEPIMKEIRPDIIIVPTFGSRGSMWQEITGRGRNTPGRFILPAFTDENLNDIILKLIGAFRWELCRTMMGVAWNDITDKSLTSEYTDYIQFYKKNHDLSEDAKEKIKVQIQKNRNMMKDIFTSDYDTWINYESKGILRLNKVARSILFRYCVLPKDMREALTKQPAFSDLVMQMNASRAKTTKMLTAKYSKLFKNDSIDKDMELNLIFYRDL